MSVAGPVRVVLFGATGRMGRAVATVLDVDDHAELAGVVQKDGAIADGHGNPCGPELLKDAQVAIDFSLPEAVDGHLTLCAGSTRLRMFAA